MEQNKQLAWCVGFMLFFTVTLVGCVIAHDRGIDQAIVDHLFDFHFDPQEAAERDKDRWEADKIIEAERQRRHNEFCDEVQNWWRDSDNAFSGCNEGTYTPPDNNGCRD